MRKVYNASAEAMRPNVVMPAAGEVCIDVSMSEIISEVALPSDASVPVQLRGLRHVTVQLDDDSGNCE